MKNRNIKELKLEKTIKAKLVSSIALTKKERAKFNSICQKVDLDLLRQQNPKFKVLNSLDEQGLLNYIKHRPGSLNDEVSPTMSGTLMTDFYLWAKDKYGADKARRAIILTEKIDFLDQFRNKRFKSPASFDEFIENIKKLQYKYPKLIEKGSNRKKLNKKLSQLWAREAKKPEPLFITHKLSEIMFPIEFYFKGKKIRRKTLSRVRTRLKRAKKEGFL